MLHKIDFNLNKMNCHLTNWRKPGLKQHINTEREKRKKKKENGGMAKRFFLFPQTLIKIRAFSRMFSSSKGFSQRRSKSGVETWTPGISLSGFYAYVFCFLV